MGSPIGRSPPKIGLWVGSEYESMIAKDMLNLPFWYSLPLRLATKLSDYLTPILKGSLTASAIVPSSSTQSLTCTFTDYLVNQSWEHSKRPKWSHCQSWTWGPARGKQN